MESREFRMMVSHASEQSGLAERLRESLSESYERRRHQSSPHGVTLAISSYTGDDEAEKDLNGMWETLRASNVLLALVDGNFLDSPVCREELIRANENRIAIWAVSLSHDCTGKLIDAAPFISPNHVVTKNGRDTDDVTLNRFTTVLWDYYLKSEDFLDATSQVQKLRRQLVSSNAALLDPRLAGKPSHRRQGAIQVLRSAAVDAARIADQSKYKLDLSLSSSFLEWATAHFSNAESVTAISRSDVSQFWVRGENSKQVQKYIDDQSPLTIRLFVFKDPATLNRYRRILDASDRSYGSTGAVLVCAHGALEPVLQDFPALANLGPGADFGVLMLQGDEGGKTVPMLATLDAFRLTYDVPSPEQEGELVRLTGFLGELKSQSDDWHSDEGIDPADDHEGAKVTGVHNGTPFRILRWRDSCGETVPELAQSLGWLFENEVVADTRHVVLFDIERAKQDRLAPLRLTDFERVLLDARDQHHKVCQSECIDLREVWVGRRTSVPGVDSRTSEKLDRSRDGEVFTYALMSTFGSAGELGRWMNSPGHSLIRQDVYSKLDSRMAALYGDLAKVSRRESREAIGSKIEGYAEDSLARFDWTTIEDFELIASQAPFDPQLQGATEVSGGGLARNPERRE